MKTNVLKKLISVATNIGLVFSFGFAMSSYLTSADSINSLGTVTIQPGEEKMMGNTCINGDCTTACNVDGTNGAAKYSVVAGNSSTKFTMFMKEKDKLIAEKAVTGQGDLDFESRNYETVLFGVKNDMDNEDEFTGSVSAKSLSCQHYNSASSVLAPFIALVGGLLLLF